MKKSTKPDRALAPAYEVAARVTQLLADNEKLQETNAQLRAELVVTRERLQMVQHLLAVVRATVGATAPAA